MNNRLSLRRRAAQLLSWPPCVCALFSFPGRLGQRGSLSLTLTSYRWAAQGDCERMILVRDGRIVVDRDRCLRSPMAQRSSVLGAGSRTPGFILIGTSASTVEFPLSTQFNDSATDAYTAAFDMQSHRAQSELAIFGGDSA